MDGVSSPSNKATPAANGMDNNALTTNPDWPRMITEYESKYSQEVRCIEQLMPRYFHPAVLIKPSLIDVLQTCWPACSRVL